MRNWWIKLGCLLTGWDYSILQSCTEASRKQLKKYTSAILILTILWAFIGYSFAERYVHTPLWGSLIAACVAIIIIVQIERQIILTVGQNRLVESFRIVIAFIMAIIGSTILDQIIFKDDISKRMVEIVDIQVNEQFPERSKNNDIKLNETRYKILTLEKQNQQLNLEYNNKPLIEKIETKKTETTEIQSDGRVRKVPKTEISKTYIDNPIKLLIDANNKNLDFLRKQYQEQLKRGEVLEDSIRAELTSKQGFLEELNVLIKILFEFPIALAFYAVLFIFLMSLELLVVFSKMGDRKSDYDKVVIHQLDQKLKTLEALVKTD